MWGNAIRIWVDVCDVLYHIAVKKSFINEWSEKQMLVEASSVKTAPTRSDHYADKPNDLSRDIKILSTSASTIIPNSLYDSQTR